MEPGTLPPADSAPREESIQHRTCTRPPGPGVGEPRVSGPMPDLGATGGLAAADRTASGSACAMPAAGDSGGQVMRTAKVPFTDGQPGHGMRSTSSSSASARSSGALATAVAVAATAGPHARHLLQRRRFASSPSASAMSCGARATAAAADAAAAEQDARLSLQRRTPQRPSFDDVLLRHTDPLTSFSVSPRFSFEKPGFSFSILKSTQVPSASTDLQQQDLVSTSSVGLAPAVSVDAFPGASEGRLSTSGGGEALMHSVLQRISVNKGILRYLAIPGCVLL